MSSESDLERARQISRANSDMLLSKPNVVAVGVGYREESQTDLVIVVMVERKLSRTALAEDDLVPNEIDGLPVEVRVVGEVSVQEEQPEE